jgi:hypothetical protein
MKDLSKADQVLAAMEELHWRRKVIYEDGGQYEPSDIHARLMTGMVEQMTLIDLLIKKGLLTEDEYFDALLDAYGKEIRLIDENTFIVQSRIR